MKTLFGLLVASIVVVNLASCERSFEPFDDEYSEVEERVNDKEYKPDETTFLYMYDKNNPKYSNPDEKTSSSYVVGKDKCVIRTYTNKTKTNEECTATTKLSTNCHRTSLKLKNVPRALNDTSAFAYVELDDDTKAKYLAKCPFSSGVVFMPKFTKNGIADRPTAEKIDGEFSSGTLIRTGEFERPFMRLTFERNEAGDKIVGGNCASQRLVEGSTTKKLCNLKLELVQVQEIGDDKYRYAVIDSLTVVSGIANNQDFNTAGNSRSGGGEPIPEGTWLISSNLGKNGLDWHPEITSTGKYSGTGWCLSNKPKVREGLFKCYNDKLAANKTPRDAAQACFKIKQSNMPKYFIKCEKKEVKNLENEIFFPLPMIKAHDNYDGTGPIQVRLREGPAFVETSRDGILMHLDNNAYRYPGTAGCVGIDFSRKENRIINDVKTVGTENPNDNPKYADLKKFLSWFADSTTTPDRLYVSWGLGTYARGFEESAIDE